MRLTHLRRRVCPALQLSVYLSVYLSNRLICPSVHHALTKILAENIYISIEQCKTVTHIIIFIVVIVIIRVIIIIIIIIVLIIITTTTIIIVIISSQLSSRSS